MLFPTWFIHYAQYIHCVQKTTASPMLELSYFSAAMKNSHIKCFRFWWWSHSTCSRLYFQNPFELKLLGFSAHSKWGRIASGKECATCCFKYFFIYYAFPVALLNRKDASNIHPWRVFLMFCYGINYFRYTAKRFFVVVLGRTGSSDIFVHKEGRSV